MNSKEEIQDWLVDLFADWLKVRKEELDIRVRFKKYGLDSATAIQLTGLLGRHLDRPLDQTLLWDYPCISDLAGYLSGEKSNEPPSLTHTPAGKGYNNEPVAIVGMACRFPGAEDKAKFWQLLLDSGQAVTEIPADRWDPSAYYDADRKIAGKMDTRWGGFLPDIDKFDPGFFGISPREAIQMDPQQRIMLELSWQALQDAGIVVEKLNGSRTGVFFGAIWNDYLLLNKQRGLQGITQHSATGNHHSIIANRVSYTFGLQGPSMCIDTACSASLVSVHLAVNSLLTGESTVALTGGVNLILSPDSSMAMSKFGAMAPDGRCKAFDASANGYVRGEGAGIVVLKTLSKALADGDRIYCLIAGSAVNNDGFSNGLTAPNPKAQENVLLDAYRNAGVDPGSVRYIEAHGTGTLLGDPIEARSIGKVFSETRAPNTPLWLGSVKTNIGHLEAAAGIAGLIKAALSVRNRMIPANLHFREPNPNIPFDPYQLRVPVENISWPGTEPAVAGVSSFGFGGTNCHLVLKEWRGVSSVKPSTIEPSSAQPSSVEPSGKPLVFVFSGQGSQWPGMGRGLLRSEPVFRVTLQHIDEYFLPLSGWSIIAELQKTPDQARWQQTDILQPLIFAVQAGLAELWRSWGIRPEMVIGHSMGEPAAAFSAEILSLREATEVIYHRSRLMATQAGKGMMAVLGASREETLRHLSQYSQLYVGGMNSPRSTVVTGDKEEIGRLVADMEKKNIFCRQVSTNIASHSPQMEPLNAQLMAALEGLCPRPGICPMLSTVVGKALPGSSYDAAYWVDNMNKPVQFLRVVSGLMEVSDPLFMELSPHPVLKKSLEETALISGKNTVILTTMEKEEDETATLLAACTGLQARGYPLDHQETHEPAILTLSAHSRTSLRSLAAETCRLLRHSGDSFLDLVYTHNLRRGHLPYRMAVVADGKETAALQLEEFLEKDHHPAVIAGEKPLHERQKRVFVFSGQGSQWEGMGAGLYDRERVFREKIGECETILDNLGMHIPLSEMIRDRQDKSHLAETDITQVIIFSLQVALAAVWKSWGIEPAATVGHSLGEIAAAHLARAISLKDALRLVWHRGRYCRLLKDKGAMASVSLSAEQVKELIDIPLLEPRLEIAAVNSPENTVVSGELPELEELLGKISALPVKTKIISKHYAFHSRQVDAILQDFSASIGQLKPAGTLIPFYSTVSGSVMNGEALDCHYWTENLRRKVLFSATMEQLFKDGYTDYLEIGPHPELGIHIAGIRRVPHKKITIAGSLTRMHPDTLSMFKSLAQWYVRGADIRWDNVLPANGKLVDLPVYPFQREAYWLPGVNNKYVSPCPISVSPYPLPGKPLRYPGQGDTISYQAFQDPQDYEAFRRTPERHLLKEHHLLEEHHLLREMSLAAGRSVFHSDDVQIDDVQMPEQMPNLFDERPMLQIDLLPAQEPPHPVQEPPHPAQEAPNLAQEARNFELFAFSSSEDRWQKLMSGTLKTAKTADPLQQYLYGMEWTEPYNRSDNAEADRQPDYTKGVRVINLGDPYDLAHPGIIPDSAHPGMIFDPADPEHFTSLLEQEVRSHPQKAVRLIYWLSGAGPGEVMAALRRLLLLSQVIRSTTFDARISLGVINQGSILSTSLQAIIRTMRAEAPRWPVFFWDCDGRRESLDLLLADLDREGEEQDLSYYEGKRRTQRLKPIRLTTDRHDHSSILRPGSTYLITGGLGEIGFALADMLVRNGATHLALSGRQMTPARMSRIKVLEERGINIQTLLSDIGDYNALEKWLASLTPPLGGIIHAAGVATASPLDDIDWEEATEVLHPKIDGTWNLHLLTKAIPLDFFIAFSSLSSLIGFKKLGCYAFANAFLDAVIRYRRSIGLPGLTLNWGPIAAGMTFDGRHFSLTELDKAGMSRLSLNLAMDIMQELLFSNRERIIIADVDWEKLNNSFPAGVPLLSGVVTGRGERSIQKTTSIPWETGDLTFVLKQITEDVLQDPQPDFNKSLLELGVDSLMIVEMIELIGRKTNIPVSPSLLYKSSSVYDLADKMTHSISFINHKNQ